RREQLIFGRFDLSREALAGDARRVQREENLRRVPWCSHHVAMGSRDEASQRVAHRNTGQRGEGERSSDEPRIGGPTFDVVTAKTSAQLVEESTTRTCY